MRTTSTFEYELARANDNQRQAIEAIDGPVMVIAGPGTGKTQILGLRIGYILQQTDIFPSNILCLTYTTAGVTAMRNRLASFIGPTAYQVHIHTFHSFCNEIIQNRPEEFSSHSNLRPMDELEKKELLKKIVEEIPPDSPLTKIEMSIVGQNLQTLFNVMQKENWSSDYLIRESQAAIDDLPNNPDYIYKRKSGNNLKGDLKVKDIEAMTNRLNQTIHAAALFDKYNALKAEAGIYDFNDMILWVNSAIKEDENLLLDLREQFQYILVDEYQDTNGAQNELIFQLAGSPQDRPNIFVVGDDDQSIYRFQGANMLNMLEFYQNYNPQICVLVDNYRSSAGILSAANQVISYNQERLVNQQSYLTKILTPAGDNKTYSTVLNTMDYSNECDEALGVYKHIQHLIDSGVSPSEIAVLYIMHKKADGLVNFLKSRNIPFRLTKSENLLNVPLILFLINALDFLSNETNAIDIQNDQLFKLLHHPMFKLDTMELAEMYYSFLQSKGISWLSYLADYSEKDEERIKQPERLKTAIQVINSWLNYSVNQPTLQSTQHVLSTPLLLNFINTSAHPLLEYSRLQCFWDFIKNQCDRHPDIPMKKLVQDMNEMRAMDIELMHNSMFDQENAIQLMTAFGAKGLEFDHVIVLGSDDKSWEDKGSPPFPFTLPKTLTHNNSGKDDEKARNVEEKRRLYYVAVTRARKSIYLTWNTELYTNKPKSPSQFVTEVIQGIDDSKLNYRFTDKDRIDYMQAQFTQTPTFHFDDNSYLQSKIERMIYSVSHLNTYLRCPVAFYYERILHAPMPSNKHIIYGNAVHKALQHLFDQHDLTTVDSADLLIGYFSQYLSEDQNQLTKIEYAQLLDLGKHKLLRYFEHNIAEWRSIDQSICELGVKEAKLEGVPVIGIFDRVDINPTGAHIVDYKTSTYSADKIKKPSPMAMSREEIVTITDESKREYQLRKLNGSDQWRQLVFYKMMAEIAEDFPYPFQKASISYVNSDDKPDGYMVDYSVTPEDEQLVLEQLNYVVEKVRQQDFSLGCGLSKCTWCSMLSQ